ncbi:transcription factor domain-containing protein [Aspergillus mulundensis]|uniref:Xylanolytic transcriptional activator regulatory domain-containing protein n=1 Tax=Aspergillus mulundensis TaxID=1810919 RepID=A0A3D8T4L0_9EURO|nr:hypothetical protein DSM5745_00824 [Aspergillus mulundensis]RDW93502.1 hypothetical protein DSM5745_00824 [Aspergillus mulundensis]
METPEIGSLTAHSPQESQFVGSSSGVFFINTVRRAFGSTSREFPQPEDTLVGSEDTLHGLHRNSPHGESEETPVSRWEYDSSIACVLGLAPPQSLARDLMMVYFKVWHPLFPFLHGPTFLRAMEGLYRGSGDGNGDGIEAGDKNQHKEITSTAWTAIFQCIFHLASLVSPELQLPPECHIQPPISASIHTLLTPLTARHDLLSLQALLAAQLYLVATMSLRTASTVGGCMLRSMLHAGLHRCPFRYRELSASASSQHRHLRKRIFWSAYALDRYLSQALGLPLGVQDSDIDVCPPGAPEAHRPLVHLPTANSANPKETPNEAEAAAEAERTRKETPFASYVQSGKLTGEALELFHKSIYVRSISQTSVLLLTTSVHKWWNGLDLPAPPVPQPSTSASLRSSKETAGASSDLEKPFNYTPFFTILYHHLLLLLHRPSLSLPSSTPEFASALQSCISAARHILSALTTQKDAGQALFWPGFLSAAWMAGLVLAFACQLGQYVLAKGCAEIEACLAILKSMAGQWEPARHCHRALGLLLRAVERGDGRAGGGGGGLATAAGADGQGLGFAGLGGENGEVSAVMGETGSTMNPRKRRRVEPSYSTGVQSQDFLEDERMNADSALLGENALDTQGEMMGQDVSWDQSLGLDMNMVDLLQEGNFDSLMDLFGQQYPTF